MKTPFRSSSVRPTSAPPPPSGGISYLSVPSTPASQRYGSTANFHVDGGTSLCPNTGDAIPRVASTRANNAWRTWSSLNVSRVRRRSRRTVEPGDLPRKKVGVEIRSGPDRGAGAGGELQRLMPRDGKGEGPADPGAVLPRRGRAAVHGRVAPAVPRRV